MYLSLTQYLSVTDNARDAVLLHVSSSSERQELRNETVAMTKTTERQSFNTQRRVWNFCLLFVVNRVSASTFQT